MDNRWVWGSTVYCHYLEVFRSCVGPLNCHVCLQCQKLPKQPWYCCCQAQHLFFSLMSDVYNMHLCLKEIFFNESVYFMVHFKFHFRIFLKYITACVCVLVHSLWMKGLPFLRSTRPLNRGFYFCHSWAHQKGQCRPKPDKFSAQVILCWKIVTFQ